MIVWNVCIHKWNIASNPNFGVNVHIHQSPYLEEVDFVLDEQQRSLSQNIYSSESFASKN